MAATRGQKAISTAQIVLALLVVAGIAWIAFKLVGYSQAQGVYREMESAYANELDGPSDAGWCPVDFEALAVECPEVVGWLTMDDFDLSYALVQGGDNDFYLYNDSTCQPNIDGAIFVDYRNKSLATDKHVIVYGHNMLDESMFGQLDNYVSEQYFFGNSRTFSIYTPDGVSRYQIFAANIVNPTDDVYQVGFKLNDVFGAFIDQVRASAMYNDEEISVSGTDQVVTLSTCSDSNRLVLNAKRVSEQPWAAR